MKKLNNLGVLELNTREKKQLDGGVMVDKDGRGCTEHGFPFDPSFPSPKEGGIWNTPIGPYGPILF